MAQDTEQNIFKNADSEEIVKYLSEKGLAFDLGNQERVRIRQCPSCLKAGRDCSRSDNIWTLAVRREGGAFNCARCGFKGSWSDFRRSFGDSPARYVRGNKSYNRPDKAKIVSANDRISKPSKVVEYLASRGLKKETLDAFLIGAADIPFVKDKEDRSGPEEWESKTCVILPYYRGNEFGEPVLLSAKIRDILNKKNMRITPKQAEPWLFGDHLVDRSKDHIIICEGEYDAMSVWQETGMNVVSLPNGSRSFHGEFVFYVESFEKIIIAFDDDSNGIDARNQVVNKLDRSKCSYIEWRSSSSECKDANDLLKSGSSIQVAIDKRKRFNHESILKAEDHREAIIASILHKTENTGVEQEAFPSFNELYGGLRMGELSVWSGPSGLGKTTTLCQISLEWAKKGVATCWGSFEIGTEKLYKKMLHQLSCRNVMKMDRQAIGHWYDVLSDLPIYSLEFYDNVNIKSMFEAMLYGVKVYDVKHFIVDNMQFLIGTQFSGYDKFGQQDKVVEMLRQFSKKHHVHVSVVVHPAKHDATKKLTNMNLYGSVKTAQEAQNIIILEREGASSYMRVSKCREKGDLDSYGREKRAYFHYDPEVQSIWEVVDPRDKDIKVNHHSPIHPKRFNRTENDFSGEYQPS
jgi:twinkle protein